MNTNLHKRNTLRLLGTGTAIAALAPGTLLLTGCDKPDVEKWAKLVNDELHAIRTQLVGLGLPAVRVDQALNISDHLVTAIKAADIANIRALLIQLTGVGGLIGQLADDIGVIAEPHARQILEGVLIIVHTTLLLIDANLPQPAAGVGPSRAPGQPANKLDATFRVVFMPR